MAYNGCSDLSFEEERLINGYFAWAMHLKTERLPLPEELASVSAYAPDFEGRRAHRLVDPD